MRKAFPTLYDQFLADRTEWSIEIVRAPRPSCMAAHAARLRLSRMCIGDLTTIGEHNVSRVATDKGRVKGYRIGEWRLTFAEVLDVVEGRRVLVSTKPTQLPLPFGESEAA